MRPDLATTQLAVDLPPADVGVDIGYEIRNIALPSQADMGLYWATGGTAALLTVTPPLKPVVSSSPANAVVAAGQPATFTAARALIPRRPCSGR